MHIPIETASEKNMAVQGEYSKIVDVVRRKLVCYVFKWEILGRESLQMQKNI